MIIEKEAFGVHAEARCPDRGGAGRGGDAPHLPSSRPQNPIELFTNRKFNGQSADLKRPLISSLIRSSLFGLFAILSLTRADYGFAHDLSVSVDQGEFGRQLPALNEQLSANYFIVKAIEVSEMAERGNIQEIYTNSSTVMKTAQSSDAFVAQIRSQIRPSAGTPARSWLSVRRESVGGIAAKGSPPPGNYVVVLVGVEIGPSLGRVETVTFFSDPDGKWRICGFAIREIAQNVQSSEK